MTTAKDSLSFYSSSAGVSLTYISQKLSYKNRPDLQIYHPKHLESTFIEILLRNKSSCIVGAVYKHLPMKPYTFNTAFSQLLQILKKKTKNNYNRWLYNLDPLNYAKIIGTYEFLESISSNKFTPQINLPKRTAGTSSTLIDNILVKFSRKYMPLWKPYYVHIWSPFTIYNHWKSFKWHLSKKRCEDAKKRFLKISWW